MGVNEAECCLLRCIYIPGGLGAIGGAVQSVGKGGMLEI